YKEVRKLNLMSTISANKLLRWMGKSRERLHPSLSQYKGCRQKSKSSACTVPSLCQLNDNCNPSIIECIE
ncbi:558_t:CDS:2, partial [Funneliformis mosseae]